MACFYSLCVSPCLFFIPSSSSSHSAINPNSHLSDQREGWSFSLLIHLQFARRWDTPVSRDQQARPAPMGSLQPSLPASQALLSIVRAGRRAGPGVGGQAPLPRMFLLLESLMHLVSACPLSWAPLQGWSGRHGAWHEAALHLHAQARPAVCSRWSSGVVMGAIRAIVRYVYLWGLPQPPLT